MKSRIARIAVRPDNNGEGCLVLGLTHPDVFKPGMVYEIIEIGGEHVIRCIGESYFAANKNGASWGRTASSIVMDGGHLLTTEEVEERRKLYEAENGRD